MFDIKHFFSKKKNKETRQYIYVSHSKDSLIKVKKEKLGLYDQAAKELLPIEYNSIHIDGDLVIAVKNGVAEKYSLEELKKK